MLMCRIHEHSVRIMLSWWHSTSLQNTGHQDPEKLADVFKLVSMVDPGFEYMENNMNYKQTCQVHSYTNRNDSPPWAQVEILKANTSTKSMVHVTKGR